MIRIWLAWLLICIAGTVWQGRKYSGDRSKDDVVVGSELGLITFFCLGVISAIGLIVTAILRALS